MCTQKAMSTKDKILDAAIQVFAKKGFSAATTNEIAELAGVAQGSIFRYYKTKKDILRSVLLEFLDRFEEITDFDNFKDAMIENFDKSEEEFFKIMAINRLNIFINNYDIFKIIMNEVEYHEDIKALYKEKFINKERHLEEVLKKHIQSNDKFKKYPCTNIFRIFSNLVIATFTSKVDGCNCKDDIENNIKEIEKDVEIIVDIFLNGIRKSI